MPSGKSARKGASKPSAAKRPKKGKPAALPDGYRIGTREQVILRKADYPTATDAVLFSPATDTLELPENVDQFLHHQITPMTEVLDVLYTPPGELLFIVRTTQAEGWKRLQSFLDQDIAVPGSKFIFNGRSIEFGTYCELCEYNRPAADAIFSDCSDFEMPPTSSESDVEPEKPSRKPAQDPVKPVTKAKREAPLPKSLLQALRAPASSLPPLPEIPGTPFATSPETMDVFEPEPDAVATPPASQEVTPPFTGQDPAAPKDSPTSAPTETAQRPRRKLRFRAVNFSSLAVTVPEQPAVKTVLIRPTSQGDSLQKLHPKAITTELSSHGEFTGLRDIRLGGIAVDFPLATDLAPLLDLTCLAGVSVTCHRPKDACSCSAVLSGVHPLVSEEEVTQDLTTSPPCRVLAVKRLAKPGQQSWTVKVTFEGTSLPERGFLYGRSRRLLPYAEKPLFCSKCARFGHPARTCRSSRRCTTCSLDHEEEVCPNATKPLCPNCGGGHDARDAVCQARQFQQKICEVRASSRVPHKVARTAVTKAAKSYADAAKGSSVPPKKAPEARAPAFIPNVAHPRPPSISSGQTANSQLAAIFRGLVAILTAAISSGDLTGAISKMAGLFAEQAPGADPGLFTV